MALNNAGKFKIASNFHYCEFEWIIDNFSNIHQDLFSQEFTVADYCAAMWKVILELKNSCQSKLMRIKFCVTEKNDRGLKVKFFYKLFGGDELINSFEGIIPFINKSESIEINKPQYLLNHGWAVDGNYNGILSDRLRIEGTLAIQNCCQKNNLNVVKENVFQLQTDFKFLLENKDFTDVALNVENQVVRAHKCLLCARSPVFRKMIEEALTKGVHHSIDIEDMEKSKLETFLEFLYTGKLETSNFETVTALYSAAKKYQVTTLQDICRETLLTILNCPSADNVCIILKLADTHNDNILKEKATVYICDNYRTFYKTVEWAKLTETDPLLNGYIMERLIERMRE